MTDAFKPDQVPGASQPIGMGMGVASQSASGRLDAGRRSGWGAGAGNGM